jgi:UPF0176 protein
MSEGDASFLVAAFYKFVALDDLEGRAAGLRALAAEHGVRGTVLLAEEGVNGTVCGTESGVRALLQHLRRDARLADLEAKFARARTTSFGRFKAKVKREIVTMNRPCVRPADRVGTYVDARAWDELVRDPGTLVIDTRNAFECALGSFENAIDPKTKSFGDFPRWVEEVLRPLVVERQPKAIAMFCTGGIRCEKATSLLLDEGFTNVHHLRGGILRYFEETPSGQGTFRGECFVFDERVAVNDRLEPGTAVLCIACGHPVTEAERLDPRFEAGVRCPHCAPASREG